MELTIILPTYNEAKNIDKIIPQIEEILKKKRFEILIVDDGSTDGTRKVAKKHNKKYENIRVMNRGKKMGLGSALRDGYNNAKGKLILSMDSDQSLDPKDILRLLKEIKTSDLVVGSRHHKKGGYQREQTATRIKYVISSAGNRLNRFISGVEINDFTLNFRIIRSSVWRAIKTKETTNIMLFEMILKTHYNGFKVKEIPVVFKERVYGSSKLNLFKEAPKFFLKMFIMSVSQRLRGTTKRNY